MVVERRDIDMGKLAPAGTMHVEVAVREPTGVGDEVAVMRVGEHGEEVFGVVGHDAEEVVGELVLVTDGTDDVRRIDLRSVPAEPDDGDVLGEPLLTLGHDLRAGDNDGVLVQARSRIPKAARARGIGGASRGHLRSGRRQWRQRTALPRCRRSSRRWWWWGVLTGLWGEVLFLLPETPAAASSVTLAEARAADNVVSALCLNMAPNEASIAVMISSSYPSSLCPLPLNEGNCFRVDGELDGH